MEVSGSNLRDLFSSTRKRQGDLSQLDPRTDSYKQIQREVISNLVECRNLLIRLATFSPNEEIDDISSNDLQYLAVDYLLAEILLKSYEGDRQQVLRQTLELFDNFLTRLEQYGILFGEDKKLYEQFQQNKDNFSLAATTNVEERRRIKVARFKEEKSLKTKLEYLRNQSKSINADDELMRSLYLAEVSFFSNQTFQSIDMITQETVILAQARLAEPNLQVEVDERENSNGRSTDNYSERLDPRPGLLAKGPLLSKSGKPLQPFTLTDQRTQLRDGVFRPSHNLPTMSIDEYLEEEKRRGGILDSNSGSNGQTVEFDEDNLAHVDAATMKARDWDEFVEANPKGAGNTLNRG